MLVETVVGGQLWFISNASLTSKIRSQLNSYIFAKALRRKDATSSEATPKKEDPEEKEESKRPTFTSKHQVLNCEFSLSPRQPF
jgi:hypothetical protein